jgi:O-succinylbenzoic acid--CoA ligase
MRNSFYFQPGVPPVSWEDRETVVLANPQWVQRQTGGLADIARRLPALEAHVWVATSGTSRDTPGRLRWVALSKDAFLASAGAVNAHLSATSSDIWAHALPVFHVGGLGILARAWLSGSQVVPTVSDRWSAADFHVVVAQSGATLAALVPSQVFDLVAAGLHSPPSLRAIVVGGARLEPTLWAAGRGLGWPCLPCYGLTETCSQVATAAPSSLGSHDYPAELPVLSHAEIRADEDARLSIRAASLLTCSAEFDADDLHLSDPKRDGWLETDDIGRLSNVGVSVLGRISEFVKVLGETVSLRRVEHQLWCWAEREGLQGISGFDLGVVGIPHARLGVELVAALVAGSDRSQARRDAITVSLDAYCRGILLPFERIQRVAWVDAIPRTPLGKVQRALLARQVGEQPSPDR